ncbi:PREDICTED: tetraspanin-8 isoform X1 [Gavialis gangeticus]|uniref:tetraspanin-8 isoform X1 n=1 Tax=Gavialis gangeticus TaxID=94835 RepID=UPI00092EAA03|nr:PREDICTED: tetraspanin-8 isoform X1 [Gavialis gangeticus]
MAGVSSCMKYSMFIFNFLFWVCGCVILGVSIWIRVNKDAQEDLNIDSSLFAGVDLLIAVGSIIMVLGFLGCCGAVKESQCMLLLFFIGLLLILILQITAGILGAVYRSKVDVFVNQTLVETTKQLQSTESQYQIFQNNFETLEQENHCCGLMTGPTDWGTNFNSDTRKACECPESYNKPDVCTSYHGKNIYKKTCGTVIIDYLKDHMIILMGIAFGLAVVEIVGLGFSMGLYCQINRK